MTKQLLAKAASVVAVLTLVSKLLGFLRETSLAAVFGATAETDAYVLGLAIPYLLFATLSYALTTTFIPVYSHVSEQQGREAGLRFANSVFWAVLCIALLFVVAGEVFAEQLVSVVAPGLDAPVASLTAYLTRVIFPMMVFQLLSGVAAGILNAENEFRVPTAAELTQNAGIIVSILVFGPRYGIVAVAAGTVAGAAISLALKFPALVRAGFRLAPALDMRDPSLRRMAVLMAPAMLWAGADQVNALIDRMLASSLPEGRVAALSYAYVLMNLAPGIIGVSVSTVVYPTWARLAAREEWARFGAGVVRSLSHVYFLLAPIAAGALVLREPLVRIVYERGVFDAAATQETAWALLFLSFGIVVFPMYALIVRAFVTLQDTRTPLTLSIVTVAINIALNFLLIGPLEQGGLALANVVAIAIGLVLGLGLLGRKLDSALDVRPLVVSAGKGFAASVVMGIGVSAAYAWAAAVLEGQGTLVELARIGAAGIAGAVVYLLMTWALRVPELRDAAGFVRSLR